MIGLVARQQQLSELVLDGLRVGTLLGERLEGADLGCRQIEILTGLCCQEGFCLLLRVGSERHTLEVAEASSC